MNEMLRSDVEVEKSDEKTAVVLGRLKDFGIGNPNGIPSRYAEASPSELEALAEEKKEKLVAPTELGVYACIDGRRRVQNKDGSKPEIRLRRVGGSASNFGVALNAEASIVDTLDPEASLSEEIQRVDEFIGTRSAHEGGCGGANGEIEDHELIATNPAVLETTKALMEHPLIKEYLGVGYDDGLGERVRHNAAETALFLREKGWNGQAYVDGVVEEAAHNVEDLEVDPDDHQFHGHHEGTLTIIIGDETIMDDDFTWNLKTAKEVAEKLAGQRGREGYQQALIAEIAKHAAVAHRLPSDEAPIILLAA